MRILLLGGSAGRPTTLADEGRRAWVIDASLPRPIHPEVLGIVQASVGRIFGQLGAQACDSRAWGSLPTVSHLSAIREFLDALADPQYDRIVMDCGTATRAMEILRTPSTLLRLLDAVLTPQLAMWRFPAEADSGPTVFEALSDARHELLRMERALGHAETLLRILIEDPDDEADARDAASIVGLLGVASEAWLTGQCILQVPPLTTDPGSVVEADGEYILELGIREPALSRSRVGRSGDDLVVEIDETHRWLALPSVLLRCQAVDASRTADGLRVRFVPDPDLWRQPAEGAS